MVLIVEEAPEVSHTALARKGPIAFNRLEQTKILLDSSAQALVLRFSQGDFGKPCGIVLYSIRDIGAQLRGIVIRTERGAGSLPIAVVCTSSHRQFLPGRAATPLVFTLSRARRARRVQA